MIGELTEPIGSKLDELEVALSSFPKVEIPVTHRFTPGMYIREIFIPAGTMFTSMKHKTEHPFVISKGRVVVSSDNEGKVVYESPYTGVTTPGTRRAIYAETDAILTTFHATEETDVEKIGEAILEPYENKLMQGVLPEPAWKQSLPNRKLCHS